MASRNVDVMLGLNPVGKSGAGTINLAPFRGHREPLVWACARNSNRI